MQQHNIKSSLRINQVAVVASGGFVLCNQFSLQQREAHGGKSDSKLRTNISYCRSWRRILLTLMMPSSTEHRRRASCPDSKPHQLMKGWQCWQGSAEPTTPPSLWAQSLHRDKNDRGCQRIKVNPCSVIHSFCSVIIHFVTWIPKSNSVSQKRGMTWITTK